MRGRDKVQARAPSHFVRRLRAGSGALRFLFFFSMFFALAFLSILLTRASDGVAVLWMPNAFAAAILVKTVPSVRLTMLAGFLPGVFLANVSYGDPWSLSALLTATNLVEVILFTVAYRLFVGAPNTSSSHKGYLRFVGFAVLPSAALAALPGAAIVSQAFGVPYTVAYAGWFISDATSLMAIVPVAMALSDARAQSLGASRKEWMITAVSALVLLAFVAVPKGSGNPLLPYFLIIPMLSVVALWIGRLGTIALTFTFLIILSLRGFAEATSGPEGSAFGDPQTAFALIFFSGAIAINLIAIFTDRLKEDEANQRDLSQMKTRFISTMSHEIRTPMNAIHGILQLFERADISEKHQGWTRTGLSASRALQHQVNQYLDLSRLDADAVALTPRTLVLADVLEIWETAADASIKASGKPLNVTALNHAGADATVRVDENRLTQIVLNLISNAVKFSETGTITIETRIENADFCVTVSDNGGGLTADETVQVFERFWQGQTGDARDNGGSGLGLSIARDLARAMGGDLMVESQPGEGSSFDLYLPLSPQENMT